MSTLTGQAINASYEGLLKTLDNAAISGTNRVISDGVGNALPLEASTTTIKFTGNADFTSATVTGIAAGGLVSGTGTDSMQSASSLTTVAANASAADTVALGDSATASSSNNIAIGNTANAGGDDAFARGNVAIGFNTDATNEKDVAIGNEAQATGSRTVAIGDSANASGSRAVVVGASSTATAFSSAVFGAFSTASAEGATVVGGYGSSATEIDAIAVGKEADALAAGAIAIGKLAQATATDAIALGKDVTGNIASTLSVKAIELQTDSTPTLGGIIMSDAGGTDRRINIDATGALQIDSTPVGGGGAAGFVNGTGTDSLKQADALTNSAATASGAQSVAIGNGARATGPQAVALGDGAEATGIGAAAVGQYAEASGIYSSAWGRTSYARVEGSVAFGQQAGVPNDANLAGAVSMGRGVVAENGDTTHVRALYIVAPDGGTGGNGITMLSPNGTAYTLTVSNAGALVIS
jgi:hypothetical protein